MSPDEKARGPLVVAVLTGHLLKDPAAIIEGDLRPIEIDADVDALKQAMGKA